MLMASKKGKRLSSSMVQNNKKKMNEIAWSIKNKG